jgi:hypothetical protein
VILTALPLLLRLSTSSFRTRKYLRALEAGDLSWAEQILKLGIHPQAVLAQTITQGSASLLQKLIFSGVNLRAADQENPLRLAMSSSRDSQAKLQLLASSGADLDGTTGPKKLKLLNWAIFRRDRKFFDFLIRNGANIHAADRNGLTPLAAARIFDEPDIEKNLRSLGAVDENSQRASDPLPDFLNDEKLLEHLVINENLFLSELHQLIKWCIKNSGFRLTRVTLPREQTLRFRIQSQDVHLRIELALLYDQQITLFIYKGEEFIPFSSLLPFTSTLDSKSLRGHVVTFLKEMEAEIQNGTFQFENAKVSSPQSLETEKALQTLGLASGATEQQIIVAYRTLAKRYHPDLAKGSGHNKMSEINRAYASLRK